MNPYKELRAMRIEDIRARVWEDTSGVGRPDMVSVGFDREDNDFAEFELDHIYCVITVLLALAQWAQAYRLANPTMTPLEKI